MPNVLIVCLLGVVAATSALAEPGGSTQWITGRPIWIQLPGDRSERPWPRHVEHLPRRATVVLDCLVWTDGTLRCAVERETPRGWGFGQYALRLSRDYKMGPRTVEGHLTYGLHYRLRVPFRSE